MPKKMVETRWVGDRGEMSVWDTAVTSLACPGMMVRWLERMVEGTWCVLVRASRSFCGVRATIEVVRWEGTGSGGLEVTCGLCSGILIEERGRAPNLLCRLWHRRKQLFGWDPTC